jgi:hypothetical protein
VIVTGEHSDGAYSVHVADGVIEIVLTCEYMQEVLLLEFNLSGATQMSCGESQTLYVFVIMQSSPVHIAMYMFVPH